MPSPNPSRQPRNQMNHPAKPSNTRGQVLLTLGSIALLAALAVSVSFLATGCGKPPGTMKSNEPTVGPKGDPWEVAAKRLRKDTDAAACKSVLATLNRELSDPAAKGKVDKPAGLTDDALKALAATVPLSDDDKKEIREAAFSSYDPVYLGECLYLRAARSLAVAGISAEARRPRLRLVPADKSTSTRGSFPPGPMRWRPRSFRRSTFCGAGTVPTERMLFPLASPANGTRRLPDRSAGRRTGRLVRRHGPDKRTL